MNSKCCKVTQGSQLALLMITFLTMTVGGIPTAPVDSLSTTTTTTTTSVATMQTSSGDVYVPIPLITFMGFSPLPNMAESVFETCARKYSILNETDMKLSMRGLCRNKDEYMFCLQRGFSGVLSSPLDVFLEPLLNVETTSVLGVWLCNLLDDIKMAETADCSLVSHCDRLGEHLHETVLGIASGSFENPGSFRSEFCRNYTEYVECTANAISSCFKQPAGAFDILRSIGLDPLTDTCRERWEGQKEPVTETDNAFPIDFKDSVIPVCASKLAETETEINQENGSSEAVSNINNCKNIPNFVTCVKSELQQRDTWADIDQALFGRIINLDELLAAFRDMCSRLDYFNAHQACYEEIGDDRQLFTCISKSFATIYRLSKTRQSSHICSLYRDYTDCARQPNTTAACDAEFLDYTDQMNRQLLHKECRTQMYGEDNSSNTSTRLAYNLILIVSSITLLMRTIF